MTTQNQKSAPSPNPGKLRQSGSAAKAAPAKPARPGIHAAAEAGLQKVIHRNEFLRANDKKLWVAALVSIVGLVIQCAIALSVLTAKSERVYFATDRNGSLIQLYPLGQPNQKDTVVAQWVQTALVDTFSFNFTNYTSHLNKTTMEYFTTKGGEGLLSALDSVGVIDAVAKRKLIVSLTLEDTPILIKTGPDSQTGIWTWVFQANAIMTYRTQAQEHTTEVKFLIQVDRRSVMENAEGLGISRVIMQRR